MARSRSVAVIGSDDKKSAVPLSHFLEAIDELADLMILMRHRLVVKATRRVVKLQPADAGLLEGIRVGSSPAGRLELLVPFQIGLPQLRGDIQAGKGWHWSVRAVDVGGLEVHPVRLGGIRLAPSPEVFVQLDG